MWRGPIFCVPDVRGFREAESEHVGAESEHDGDAETDSEHGKPKREMSTFTACANFSLLLLSHLNTMAATKHLLLVRLLQTRANSLKQRPSYERPKWPVRSP
jgi:hypothetical protein